MIKSRKIKYILMSVLAVIMSVCTIFAVFGVPEFAHTADAATNVGRVEFIDLYNRYPTDYVIGPVDVASSDVNPVTGKYTYKSSNKDINGNPTNNIYGIPADRYFNVENYIYTSGVKDSAEGRTLYGWKSDIRAVTGSGESKGKIAENGKIMSGESVTGDTGIFVTFKDSQNYGTTVRYALIVPDDITKVGTGSAAYVYNNKSYYNDDTTGNSANKALYTDFACFIFEGISHSEAPYFWQPRERLAGVYFSPTSRLNTIEGATYSYATPFAAWSNSRTDATKAGKGAFEKCDNLRYLILPGANSAAGTMGLSSVGKHAFYDCTQIVDTNIPNSLSTIGAYAFGEFKSVKVLPRPATGGNIDDNAFYECKAKLSGDTVYVFGGAPTYNEKGEKILDNGTSGFLFESGTPWQAVGLSGETGEDASKVFIFPDSSDFNKDSDRRRGVPYDYIDRDGNKIKNDFPEGGVTSYKIADNFASGTWCQNIIMPKAVTEIGSKAFYNSGVKYLETYAIKIGADAFTNANNKAGNQWYYFHWTGNETTSSYSIPNNAFTTPNSPRHIVFENKAMYDSVGTTFTGLSNLAPSGTVVHYQIPVYAHVYSEDAETINGEGISLNYSDMDNRFFNDYDYKDYLENRYLKQGDNTIVYTKKLSGFSFSATKQPTGGWVEGNTNTDSYKSLNNPTLSHMESTVWYTGVASANTANSSAYTSQTTASALYESSTSTRVDIYTKKIKKAENIKNKTYIQDYEFGKEYVGVGKLSDTDSIGYDVALNLSGDDYKITLTNFTFPDNRTDGTSRTDVLQNAGDYSFGIQVGEKWGVWSSDYISLDTEYFTANVTIERQQLDFTDITQFRFSREENDAWTLNGNASPLYRYYDGWYLARQSDKVELDSRPAVTNAISYGGNSIIKIKLVGETSNKATDSTSEYKGAEIISRNGLEGSMSNEYTANYTFQVKFIPDWGGQSNYEFKYGSQFNESDENLGLTMTGKNQFTFRLSKQWYIVKETNLFILEGTHVGDTNGTLYSPLAEGAEITYGDNIKDVRQPELNYGHAAGKIAFEIDYTPVGGSVVHISTRRTLGASGESALGYYINKFMPAGTYVIKLYGEAVDVLDGTNNKHYDEISGEYVITVNAKALVTGAFDSAIATGGDKNAEGIGTDTYSWPYDGEHNYLYGNVTAEAVSALNSGLSSELAAVEGNSTYWKGKTQYYSAQIAVAYNLDRWGNTNYLDSTSIPVNADKYTVYYSVSAKNYKTHGGESDNNRRDKKFTVIIYNNISVKNNLLQSEILANSLYFRDVTYNGGTVQTLVPYNQHFRYAFNDSEGYVNARNGATVTLTLNNPALAKWSVDVEDDVAARFVVSEDGTTLTAYFNILPADNKWDVTPSISGWTYNGFDSKVHVVSSKLAFEDTRAYYRLSLSRNGGNWVSLGANDYFEVDSDGQVNDSAVINALKTLKPDSYYLFGYADAYDDGNVKSFDPYSSGSAGGVLVVIGKAVNRWTTSPDIIRWYWSEYDKTVNTISGVALYLNVEELTGRSIKYAILDKDNNVVDGLYGITVENGVIVDDANKTIANKIKNLGVGTYYLLATVEESDYYTGINEYVLSGVTMTPKTAGETLDRTSFVISQFVNKWNTTSPSMTSWEYKAFAASNFVAGDPVFGNASDIEYTVSGGSLATPIMFKGALTEDAKTALTALAVNNNYKLTAKLAKTDDYSELTYETTFAVTKVNNRWATTPGMTGWAYKAFTNENFRAGVPALREVADAQVVYTLSLNEDNAATIKEFTSLSEYSFADLPVGNYKIVATYAGTDNYNELTQTITFAVTKVNNRWATTPGMTGWAYKAFTNENFRAGVPALKEAADAQVVYTLSLNEDNAATIKEFTSLSEYSFADLPVGNYKIVATYAGTDNYNELTQTITFAVTIVNNTWKTTPILTGWVYGQFAESNFTAGEPNLNEGNASVVYTLSKRNASGDYVAYDFAFDLNNLKKLNNLERGNFKLTVSFAGTTNYNPLNQEITFTVSQLTNTWEENKSPVLTGWAYGQFVAGNFTAGTPNYHEVADEKIVYTLKERHGNNFSVNGATVSQFIWELTYGGEALSESTVTALNSLNVGEYVLTVSFAGNENYTALSTPINFTIASSPNSWATTPGMIGWEYTGFNAAVNFIAGVPVNKIDGAKVQYGIIESTIEPKTIGDCEKTFTDITSVTEYLTGLKVLTNGKHYYLVAYYPADATRYSSMFTAVMFEVRQASNNNITAKVDNWTYDPNDETAVVGDIKATFGTEDATFTLMKEVDGDDVPVTGYKNLTLAQVKAITRSELGAGDYKLIATVDKTDNYSAAGGKTTFTVPKAEIKWVDDETPSLSQWSWTYGDKPADIVPKNLVNTDGGRIKIVYQFYEAKSENGGLVQGDLAFEIAAEDVGQEGKISVPTDAGTYIFVVYTYYEEEEQPAYARARAKAAVRESSVEATASENINVGHLTLGNVEIGVYSNGWLTTPENSLVWTWSEHDSIENSGIVKATAKMPEEGKGNVTYKITNKADGTTYKPDTQLDKGNIYTELSKLPAGSYEIEITAEGTANYTGVNATADITVNPATLTWKEEHTPANAEWTWGVDDGDKTFIKPEVKEVYTVNATDTVRYEFTVSNGDNYNRTFNTTDDNFSTMYAAIKAETFNAGSYTVDISVTCANYNPLTATVTLTVNPAQFTWNVADNATLNTSWDWGAESKPLTELKAFDKDNVIVDGETEFRYAIGNTVYMKETEKSAFDLFKEALYSSNAGTYTVTVTASRANYATSTKTFTVTIREVQNNWTNEFTDYIEKTYQSDKTESDLVMATALRGSAVYSYNNTDYGKTALLSLINGFGVGEYKITISVAAQQGKYTGLSATLNIKVNGKGTQWNNKDNLKALYDGFNYGGLTESMKTVVIPEITLIGGGDSVTYTVYYAAVGVDINSITSASYSANDSSVYNLRTLYLENQERNAGTYKIVSTYNPLTGYAPLDYTIIINVALAQDEWETTLGARYEGTYTSELDIPDPEASRAVTVTVTNASGNDCGYTVASGSLKDFFKTRDVGRYTVTYSVAAVANQHTGLTARTAEVNITIAVNAWNAGTEFTDITVYRGDTFNITVPGALHGSTRVSFNGTPLDLTDTTINEWLNSDSHYPEAGTYRIDFIVDAKANYTGVNGSYIITVAKRDISWVNAPNNYTWTGEVNIEEFVTPTYKLNSESEETSELVRFDVTKSGTSVTDTYNAAQFATALAGFVNGTYTVVVRVGSSGLGETDSAILAYNKDYNVLSENILITVTRATNGWTTALKDLDWTYEEIPTVTRPVATHGNDKIVYTIRGTGDTVYTEKTFDFNEPDANFTNFMNEIKSLGAGSYVATATIDQTDIYGSETCSAIITVRPFAIAWTGGNTQSDFNWVYQREIGTGEGKNQMIPEFTANHGTVKYYTLNADGNKTELTDNSATPMLDESKPNVYLSSKDVGTYTIIAMAEGENSNYTSVEFRMNVVISRADNTWTDTVADNGTLEWTYNQYNNNSVVFEAAQNNGAMEVRINNVLVTGNLQDELKSLHANSYTVTVSVPESTNYNSLTKTITITVNKEKDGWKDGTSLAVAGWTWDNGNMAFAINGNDIKADGVNSETKITWTLPVPKFAAQISVAVEKPGMDTINLSVLKEGNALNLNGLESLYTRLRSLGAGSYTVTVSVAERDDYSGYSENATFTVGKATNAWNAGGSPSIIGWSFGGDKTVPGSSPKYGRAIDVVYKYVNFADVEGIPENATDEQLERIAKDLPESAWSSTQPSNEGRYFLRGYLAGTDNYGELYGYNTFNVAAGSNSFTVQPGVIEWRWDNYVKETNLFVGSASHQKSISFEIYKGNVNDYKLLEKADFAHSDGSALSDEEFGRISAIINAQFTYVDGNLVSDEIAQILKMLKPNPDSYSYWLHPIVKGEDGYEDINNVYSRFNVSKASNGWGTPTVLSSFMYNGTITFTAGTATYGTDSIKYRITGTSIQEISNLSADQVVGELEKLNAGEYTLWFGVAESNLYLSIPERNIQFGVSRAQNTWVTLPSAQINATYSEIQAMTDEQLKELYPALEPIGGKTDENDVVYELRGSSSSIKDNLTYGELLKEIKAQTAGEYIIRASFVQTTNYTAITATDTRLVISKYENSFIDLPGAFTANWHQGTDGKNATELEDFTVTAVHGTVKYTLEKTTYDTYEEFKEAVKGLDAKAYTIIVSVDPTDGYAGLDITRVLTVNPGVNSWKDGWTKENSLKLSGNVRNTWIWDSTIEWVGPVPEYGTTIDVVIRIKGQTSAKLYRTINVNSAFATSVGDIGLFITEQLDVGTYEIEVIAPASTNWLQLSDTHEFTITTKTNGWPIRPQLMGATNNITKWTWTYGNSVYTRVAAQYGEVEIRYYDKDGNELSSMPVYVGEYRLVFSVPRPESNNYTGLEMTLDCEILKATNDAFNVYPSAIGWRWHEYNRLTNLFAGDPVSGGAITYSVYDGEKAIVKNIALVNAAGVHTGKPADDLYVPEKMYDPEKMEEINVAEILAELLAGTYTLRVDVGETDNCNAFHVDVPLIVSYNRNEWTTTPQVVPWSVNNWKAADHTPQAESLFGHPTIIIRSRIGSIDYYKAVYNPETGKYDVENTLNRGEIGWYDLIATVPAAQGMYENALETTVPFQIFVQGSPDEKNYWLNSPSISGWTANTNGEFNMPVAKAARGLSYFVFYKAIWNGSSYVLGEQVTKDDEWVIKVDQEDKYYTDWYVPVEPGHYYMEARAISGSGLNDNITDERPILFEIYYRPNSFTEEPRIATLLYLGSRDYWDDPTAAAALENSEIVYTYRNIETGEDLGEEMPKTDGRFMLRATASALFSLDIYRDVEFRVELSYNGWLSSPIIDDWSEEFDPNAPTGEALIGSENIKYQYATKDDPENYFDEKPTAEGEYILHATLEIEGYVPLEHNHEFTIEPAFDKDLLIVDIILGVVGCALAVTVIVFAIRRYKEN